MSGDRGYPYTLAFRLSVGGLAAHEITVGAVWGPAVIEQLLVEDGGGTMVVRGYAMIAPLPRRVNQPLDVVIEAEPLFVVATELTAERTRTGLVGSLALERTYELGRVVPWGPWWLFVRAENQGAGTVNVTGVVRLSVFDAVRIDVRARAERRVGWWRQGRVLDGGNPDGLVAGYRGGV